MHDDSTAIMRSYLEDTISKSRKKTCNGKSKKSNTATKETHAAVSPSASCSDTSPLVEPDIKVSLEAASEEQLVAALARRRAARYSLSSATKRLPGGSEDDKLPVDPTGQICSLNGSDGTIPCRELME